MILVFGVTSILVNAAIGQLKCDFDVHFKEIVNTEQLLGVNIMQVFKLILFGCMSGPKSLI